MPIIRITIIYGIAIMLLGCRNIESTGLPESNEQSTKWREMHAKLLHELNTIQEVDFALVRHFEYGAIDLHWKTVPESEHHQIIQLLQTLEICKPVTGAPTGGYIGIPDYEIEVRTRVSGGNKSALTYKFLIYENTQLFIVHLAVDGEKQHEQQFHIGSGTAHRDTISLFKNILR